MGVIKSVNNLWTGLKALSTMSEQANSPKEKRWDDTLLAIRNNNLEEWNQGSITNPYRQNYTVNRALQILATNIAQVPFEFYREDRKLGKEFELNQVMRRPNQYTSNFELWEATIVYLFLYGESFWYFNTNQYGIIKEIYAVHPNFMKQVQDKESSPVAGWIYDNRIPMTLDEVIHFKLFNAGHVRGLSPLDTLKQDMSNDKTASELGGKMLENGSKLSGVIEVDKDVSASLEEMRRVLTMWKAEHQGVSKAGKVGALLGGMKYRELGQTASDLELIDSRDSVRDKILLVLGIHKAVVGVTDKIDRATADTALRSLWQTTLKPQTVRIQEKINAELLDVYYPGVISKFDLTVIEELKADLNDTLDAATKFWKLGYTRNEINVRLGLNMPEIEGEERYIPRIMIPESMAEEAAVTGRGTTQANDARKALPIPVPEKIVEPKASQEVENPLIKKIKGYLMLQRPKVIKTYIKYDKVDRLLEKENIRLGKSLEPFKNELPEGISKLNSVIFDKVNQIIATEGKTKDDKAEAIKNLYTYLYSRVKFIAEGEDAEIRN